MAKSKKAGRSSAPSQDLVRENEQLRRAVESQSQATAALTSQLAGRTPTQARISDLMVGIRSISDNTIGLRAPFPGIPDVQLHPDGPSAVAAIPYAWWQQLRKSKYMEDGLIVRDDSILGSNFHAAPPDRPEDLAPGWKINAIENPEAWVNKKTETELRRAIDLLTSKAALRRLRRVVDLKLVELQAKYPGDPKAAEKSIKDLSGLYQMLDYLTTARLEQE